MPDQPTNPIAIIDPRTFDGDPYEVAARAVAQAEHVARILALTLGYADLMARNAQLSRNLLETEDDARAAEWDDSAQHKRFEDLRAKAESFAKTLAQLERAASYNPKRPPTFDE